MIRVTIKRTDKGFNDIVREMRALSGRTMTVGIHADAGSERAIIASTHEYGAPSRKIPARPWLRPAFDEHLAVNERRMRGIVANVLKGKPAEPLLRLLGEGVQAQVRAYIESQPSTWAPLSPSTLARRAKRLRGGGAKQDSAGKWRDKSGRYLAGFSGHRTLMDTRQHLFNFIRYELGHQGIGGTVQTDAG